MDYEFFLNATIRRITRLERKSFSGRRRFKFYGYLAEILEYHRQLEASGELLKIRDLLLARRDFRAMSSDPLRVLIDATSKAGPKTKSRWTRALQFAVDKRSEWHGVMTAKQFFKRQGGIAGCARKIAVKRARWWKKKGEELRDWK